MPDPNNILLHDQRLCLVLPCKAANTSIKLGVAHHLGLSLPKPDEPPQFGVHNTEVFECVGLDDIPLDYLVVAAVRDPTERILSAWNFVAPPHVGLHTWLRRMNQHPDSDADQHVRSQTWDMIHAGQHRMFGGRRFRPDLFIDVHPERIQADWAALEKLLEWEPAQPLANTNTIEENGITRRYYPEDPLEQATCRRLMLSRWASDYVLYDEVVPMRRVVHWPTSVVSGLVERWLGWAGDQEPIPLAVSGQE